MQGRRIVLIVVGTLGLLWSLLAGCQRQGVQQAATPTAAPTALAAAPPTGAPPAGSTAAPTEAGPTPVPTPGPGQFVNPILDLDFPDPDTLKVGDTYYAYATNAGSTNRRASDPALTALADEDTLRNYLTFDLLTGRVTPTHPMFTWLLRNGATVGELADIASRPVPIEVMGLNFYPQWATRELHLAPDGRIRTRIVEKSGVGFEAMIEGFYRRYGVPIMITETSAKGAHGVRQAWLQASIAAVRRLRGQGVPVVGYTWFPLFTMIDWKYRLGRQPVEKYRLELGLYTLESFAPRYWRPTPLAQQFKQYVSNPAVVGLVDEKATL